MGAVEGRTLSVAACVTRYMSVSSVYVYLSVSGIHVWFCYWLNLEMGKQQLLQQPGSSGWCPVTGHEEYTGSGAGGGGCCLY